MSSSPVELNLATVLAQLANLFPERQAVIANEASVTFFQLYRNAKMIASGFQKLGIEPNDFVAFTAANCIEIIELYLACALLGAVPLALNNKGDARDHLAILETSEPKLVVSDRVLIHLQKYRCLSFTDLIQMKSRDEETAIAHKPSSEDLIAVTTGGTTGLPKIILWKQGDFISSIFRGIWDPYVDQKRVDGEEILHLARQTAGGSCLICGPLVHGAGILWTLNCLFLGGTVILNARNRFDPHWICHLIKNYDPITLVLVGDAVARPWLAALESDKLAFNGSSLRYIKSSGALLSLDVQKRILGVFSEAQIAEYIGASEVGTLSYRLVSKESSFDDSKQIPLKAFRGTAILDNGFEPLAEDDQSPGFIARTGDIALGYYKSPEKTSATFVESKGIRWGLSGDIGTYSLAGGMFFLGRGDSCINTGGEKVFPNEVEEVLKKIPEIEDGLVIGIPDPQWGQSVLAIIKLRSSEQLITLEAIKTFCQGQLASYKQPKKLYFVPLIQRWPNGKLDRKWLASVIDEIRLTNS